MWRSTRLMTGAQGDQLGAFGAGVASLLEVNGEAGEDLGDVKAACPFDLVVDRR